MNAPSWIGRTLGGRYQIEELLGQGGMSAVYKGNDPNLRRAVAIKLIHSHLSTDQHFLHRFEEEAAAVAQLRHPNIIQVYDFNQDQGTYYMVMEFVPGETLQDRLRRFNRSQRFIPLEKTIQYIQQICGAIDYAHKRGMIHRDIKPANIMIDVHDQAILMDFGIAKMVGAEKFTATGAVVGTALYMPPEAIRGETADARSDIYSLGITLYEMISGKPPFEASSAMTLMMMHLNDPVPDLSTMRPDIPRELATVIERSLAKDRTQRFASAAEMAAALQIVLARLPGAIAAVQPAEPLPPGAALKSAPAEPPTSTPAVKAPTDIHTEVEQTLPPNPRQSAATQLENSPKPPQKIPAAGTIAGTAVAAGAAAQRPPGQPPAGPPAQPAVSASPGAPAGRATFKRNLIWFALVGIAALVMLAVVVVGGITLLRNIPTKPTQTPGQAVVTTLPVVAAAPSATPSPTATNTPTPTITQTPAPSATSTPTLSPTPTLTPTPDLYVVIKSITIDNNRYVVDYETFGYEEKIPGMHVHFFFNNITPENAGMPGSGPWKLYGGPRPFREYKVSDRPDNANQMCALVANFNHSIILNSGTCLDLPK